MKKLNSKILLTIIGILATGMFFAMAFQAQAVDVDKLIVEYSSDGGGTWLPLSAAMFNETNFLPGQNITRLVRVTNNSGVTQRIATQPLNIIDPNRLGDVIQLVIKEGGTTVYNNALSNFLANGEVYLSDLANGANTQYDFTVSFYSGTQNTFQGKNLGFDILIGFQGTEGGILPGAGSTSGYGGGGGGGGLPPGLTIVNDNVQITDVGQTSVIISWLTSYNSTSQVIYGAESEAHTLDLTDTSGTPPKYGYKHTTPETDISPKITFHSVTITGLTPGTTYHFRAVSHGSLAISTDHTFTTKGQKLTQATAPLTSSSVIPTVSLSSSSSAPAGVTKIKNNQEISSQTKTDQTENEATAENILGAASQSPSPKPLLLATIGNFLPLLTFKQIIIGLIILIILLALYIVLGLRRKRRTQNRV